MIKFCYILISLILSQTFFCCTPKNSHDYNGIYEESQNGRLFIKENDTNASVAVNSKPLISLQEIKTITLTHDADKSPVLMMELAQPAQNKFYEYTKINIGKRLPLIINNKLLFSPVIRAGIQGGMLQVTGFNKDVLKNIMHYLKDKYKESGPTLFDLLDSVANDKKYKRI
jgi:preprotein translocase subunit SecD